MPSTWLRMSRPGPPNFATGLKTKLSANESQAARIRQQRKKRPSHSDDHGSAVSPKMRGLNPWPICRSTQGLGSKTDAL